MPPPKSNILEKHFVKDVGTNTYTCRYCDLRWSNLQLARARAHLAGRKGAGIGACEKVPAEVKVALADVEDAKDQKKLDAARKAEQRKRQRAPEDDDGKQDGTQPPTAKQTTLHTWLAAKVQELDVAFARFMYHAGLPFAVADDPELQTFIDTLVTAVRNGVTSYTVPTRQRVAGPLLDIVHANVVASVAPIHKHDRYTTMSADYWSNRRGEGVMNVVLTGRKGSSYVAASFPNKTQVKDHTYVADRLHEGHLQCISHPSAPTVGAVVTDNASVMTAAAAHMVSKESEDHMESKHMSTVGCVLHHYNLGFKELVTIPQIAVTVEKVRNIAVFFKRRTKAMGVLEDRQKDLYDGRHTTPPIPGKTRIGGAHMTLEWMDDNQAAIKAAVVHPDWQRVVAPGARADTEFSHDDVEDTVMDHRFWKGVKTALALLTPLWEMLRAADTDGPEYTAFVYHDCLQYEVYLKSIRETTNTDAHVQLSVAACQRAQKIWSDRWALLNHQIYTVAYVLNPKLNHNLSVLDGPEVRQHMYKVFADLGEDPTEMYMMAKKFVNRENPFCEPGMWTAAALKTSCVDWWETWTFESEVGPFREIALRCLSTACTSSGSERNFSVWGLINSSRRNRLYNGKISKLVFIYQNLRVLRKIGHPDYRDPYYEMVSSDEEDEPAE